MADEAWTYPEILDLVYSQLDDTQIERLLTALHQDLGREASLYCEICNPEGENNGS